MFFVKKKKKGGWGWGGGGKGGGEERKLTDRFSAGVIEIEDGAYTWSM